MSALHKFIVVISATAQKVKNTVSATHKERQEELYNHYEIQKKMLFAFQSHNAD